MAIKVCRVCGKEFESKTAGKVCESCKHVKCVVCGSDVELKGQTLYRYLERGWATCSQACAAKKRAETNIERYGDANPAKSEQARKKISDARKNDSDETKAKRSAALKKACSNPEVIAKRKRTNKEKYGYECAFQNSEFHAAVVELARAEQSRQRAIDTLRNNFGVENPYLIPEIARRANIGAGSELAQKRREQTCMDRYGKRSPWANDTTDRIVAYLKEHPDSTPTQVAKALRISYAAAIQQNEDHDLGMVLKSSTGERVVAEFLDSLGVPYVRNTRSVIAPYELDFYMPEHNVAIEVNDFATHNIDLNPFGGNPKPKRYHWDKTRMCDERGIRLIHAWQHCLPTWEGDSGRMGSWPVLQNVIIHALGMTPHRHYARQTRVVEFPAIQTKKFFDENNINGYRNANVTYALVPKDIECPTPDDIVMAYAVGRAYFGKGKYDAEIARGACLLGHNVVGGASKLWRYIIDNTDYQSIVYYTDRNFYQSNSLGFLENVEYVTHQDSFWNYWVDEDRLANREPARHAEIMRKREAGEVWQVNNAGTDVFVWWR